MWVIVRLNVCVLPLDDEVNEMTRLTSLKERLKDKPFYLVRRIRGHVWTHLFLKRYEAMLGQNGWGTARSGGWKIWWSCRENVRQKWKSSALQTTPSSFLRADTVRKIVDVPLDEYKDNHSMAKKGQHKGGVRAPALVSWPGKSRAGQRFSNGIFGWYGLVTTADCSGGRPTDLKEKCWKVTMALKRT